MRGLLALMLCLVCPLAANAQHGIYFDYHRPSAKNPKHIDHPHLDAACW